MLLVDHRAKLIGGVERIADPPVARTRKDAVHQRSISLPLDLLMNDQPGIGRTVFAHVPKGSVHHMASDQVEIFGVVHDDGRILAAAFQRNFS